VLVWIVNPYGTLPGEGWSDYRSTFLARALVRSGHTVVWWLSNFEHRSKRQRAADWEDRTIEPGFTARIVPSTTYSRHISVARIRYEEGFARNLAERARDEEMPDAVVLAEPALFYGGPVLALLTARPTPLIVDVIDLWPELFQLALPPAARRMGALLFAPLYARRRRLFRAADAVVAVARDYLQLGLTMTTVKHSEVVYWGVDAQASRDAAMESASPLRRDDSVTTIVYAGTLGPNYDIPTILEAARRLHAGRAAVRFAIAGDGPLASMVADAARELPNVLFLGRLAPVEVSRLYQNCDLALSSYVGQSTVSMPIKVYDYLAAGLPIINSLRRDLGALIVERGIGACYAAEDAEALRDTILRLAGDAGMRDRMRSNALMVSREFEVSAQYQRFVDLIEATVRDVRDAGRTKLGRLVSSGHRGAVR
jgi:glycosyltransferase involved in cell wall biosynthesis